MAELDSTDAVILELLLEDARRSFREISEEVELSPPTVSNRVDRLRDLGVIRRFTVEVDRTKFADEDECLVIIDTRLVHAEDVFSQLQDVNGIEHVFYTVDSTVVAKAVLPPAELRSLLTDTLTDDQVKDYRVKSILGSSWQPQLGTDDLTIECTICGNPISGDGQKVEVDSGDMYHVCCSSCAEKIVEQYESLKQAADE
ncbi:AsnC family transcriptional regulator [Haladaptatus sp. YSMS36]|uniref:AsnC family transcriptional regulator n=1 Tax=Haladaptatus sp. YSMS36 TaxID=3033384 RepID=UPI0023E82EEE|nr:AsnC family transcriptional regulator [Haladaptatus sp. YSMS36]